MVNHQMFRIQTVLWIILLVSTASIMALVWYALTQPKKIQDTSHLSRYEAYTIAQASECTRYGTLTEHYTYNDYTKTWWITMNVYEIKPECNPACVVDEETKTAEINWRCTGLIEPQYVTTTLYYYDPQKDTDGKGNVICSSKGLVPVTRSIAQSDSLLEDTIHLLINGELTEEDRVRGIITEYPLEGLELERVIQENNIATLVFKDPLNKTSGGSCRANILWQQIEKTVLQFPGITVVRFLPEELFQP